jgi:hypothetical protein
MPKPFGEDFPFPALDKGHANVFGDDFEPGSGAPVDVEYVPDDLPVEPDTTPVGGSDADFPQIPVDAALEHSGLSEEDFADQVSDDVFGILF